MDKGLLNGTGAPRFRFAKRQLYAEGRKSTSVSLFFCVLVRCIQKRKKGAKELNSGGWLFGSLLWTVIVEDAVDGLPIREGVTPIYFNR